MRLNGPYSRGMEDSGAEGNFNCGGLAQGVSEDKDISMWSRDPSCDILTAVCSCLSNTFEA